MLRRGVVHKESLFSRIHAEQDAQERTARHDPGRIFSMAHVVTAAEDEGAERLLWTLLGNERYSGATNSATPSRSIERKLRSGSDQYNWNEIVPPRTVSPRRESGTTAQRTYTENSAAGSPSAPQTATRASPPGPEEQEALRKRFAEVLNDMEEFSATPPPLPPPPPPPPQPDLRAGAQISPPLSAPPIYGLLPPDEEEMAIARRRSDAYFQRAPALRPLSSGTPLSSALAGSPLLAPPPYYASSGVAHGYDPARGYTSLLSPRYSTLLSPASPERPPPPPPPSQAKKSTRNKEVQAEPPPASSQDFLVPPPELRAALEERFLGITAKSKSAPDFVKGAAAWPSKSGGAVASSRWVPAAAACDIGHSGFTAEQLLERLEGPWLPRWVPAPSRVDVDAATARLRDLEAQVKLIANDEDGPHSRLCCAMCDCL